MKKTLFTFAAATMILGGCNNTEELDKSIAQTQKEIGFSTIVNKETRALDNSNFNKFYVFGAYTTTNNSTPVNVFGGEEVIGTVGAETWTYTGTPRYWIADASYKFAAYSCENSKFSSVGTINVGQASFGQDMTLNLNKVIIDQNHQHDLVFATAEATGKANDNSTVSFEFKHILSKVKLTFVNDYPEGYQISIKDVEIYNPRFRGTWNGTDWTDQNRKYSDDGEAEVKSITIPFNFKRSDSGSDPKESDAISSKGSTSTSEIYVLPFGYKQTAVKLNFTVTVTASNGAVVLTTDMSAYMTPTWDKGKSYNYAATITGGNTGLEKIEFTTTGFGESSNDGWISGSGGNITFDGTFAPEGV